MFIFVAYGTARYAIGRDRFWGNERVPTPDCLFDCFLHRILIMIIIIIIIIIIIPIIIKIIKIK